ncbi:MAG: DUF4388 domain-containing protein [bacterium]
MTTPTAQRVPIGQMLMAKKAISQLELNAALNHQNRWGGKLGTILNKLGYIKETTLNQVLSEIFQIPVLQLAQTEVEMEALELVPAAFAREHGLLAIKLEKSPRKTLHVAVSQPENTASLDELKFVTGISHVKAYLAGEVEIMGAIGKCYSGSAVPGKSIRLGGVEIDSSYRAGNEMVIERFNKEELIRAIDTREQGVAGSLVDMGVVEMLQILGAGGKTITIHLNGSLGTGRIYLDNGHIVHADTDYIQGPRAALELVTWQEGTFTLRPNPPDLERTIFDNNDALILEGLRLADERAAEEASEARIPFYEPPPTTTVVTPAPKPAPEPKHASEPEDALLPTDKQVRLLLRILVRKGLLTETEARAILHGKV